MVSIAATLLVLDIAVHPPGTPLQQVLHGRPDYLAYVVSFQTIRAAWLAHTGLTGRLARSDPILLQINLLGLLVVGVAWPGKQNRNRLTGRNCGRLAAGFPGCGRMAGCRRQVTRRRW